MKGASRDSDAATAASHSPFAALRSALRPSALFSTTGTAACKPPPLARRRSGSLSRVVGVPGALAADHDEWALHKLFAEDNGPVITIEEVNNSHCAVLHVIRFLKWRFSCCDSLSVILLDCVSP